MSQNTTWEVNGVSLPLDLSDADTMERYEAAFDQLAADEKAIPKDGKASARIRAYCAMFRRLYDSIFGEGTSARIFADTPDNTHSYDAVYCSLLDYVRAQSASNAQHTAELVSKYAPNRAQKRAIKHQKK